MTLLRFRKSVAYATPLPPPFLAGPPRRTTTPRGIAHARMRWVHRPVRLSWLQLAGLVVAAHLGGLAGARLLLAAPPQGSPQASPPAAVDAGPEITPLTSRPAPRR